MITVWQALGTSPFGFMGNAKYGRMKLRAYDTVAVFFLSTIDVHLGVSKNPGKFAYYEFAC